MGLNTVVMLCNDRLHDLEEMGATFAHALYRAIQGMERKDIGLAGAKVISISHSGDMQIVAVGGNRGELLGVVSNTTYALPEAERPVAILRDLARQHGYYLAKKHRKDP